MFALLSLIFNRIQFILESYSKFADVILSSAFLALYKLISFWYTSVSVVSNIFQTIRGAIKEQNYGNILDQSQ